MHFTEQSLRATLWQLDYSWDATPPPAPWAHRIKPPRLPQAMGTSISHFRGVRALAFSIPFKHIKVPESSRRALGRSGHWVSKARGARKGAHPACSARETRGKSPPGLGTRCSRRAPRLATVRKTFPCSLPAHYENPLKGAFRTTKPFKRILSTQKQTLMAVSFKST